MTDVVIKIEQGKVKKKLCYLLHESKSGEKNPNLKYWKILSNQEINAEGLIHEALFYSCSNHCFQRRWSQKKQISAVTTSTSVLT